MQYIKISSIHIFYYSLSQVASYAIIFVGLLYFIIGNCGVLSFGSQTDGNVLNNFPVSSLIVVFKMGFVLCIAFSFPLVIYPMRISVNSLFLVRNLGVNPVSGSSPQNMKKIAVLTGHIFARSWHSRGPSMVCWPLHEIRPYPATELHGNCRKNSVINMKDYFVWKDIFKGISNGGSILVKFSILRYRKRVQNILIYILF